MTCTCLLTTVLSYLFTCILTHLPIYLPAYIPTYQPTYLLAYLITCLLAYLTDLLLHGEHDDGLPAHWTLGCIFRVLPGVTVLCTSVMASLCFVFLGSPLFFSSPWFQVNACVVMLLADFPRVWPVPPDFSFLLSFCLLLLLLLLFCFVCCCFALFWGVVFASDIAYLFAIINLCCFPDSIKCSILSFLSPIPNAPTLLLSSSFVLFL